MSHRLSQNARNTRELLQELERDKELEVLREYLTRFDLFPRKRDPTAAPIRFEELKELVKHWKLHRQRNFWKNHTTKEDLVRTLYRHINTKIIPQEAREEGGALAAAAAAAAVSPLQPTPPGNAPGAGLLAMAPTAPARRTSIGSPVGESPRAKSILVTARSPALRGPRRENVLGEYCGDLFTQRGDYEDGIIYLSRFRKPGTVDMSNPFDAASEASNQESKAELEDDDASEKSHESLALADGPTREVRLKQECAFSIYHFATSAGNERRMVAEGCMLALSRLSVFDDMEVKKLCAATILNLTSEASLCARMLEEGVLLALLELAKAQNEEVRRHTSMALCRISYERAGQLRLVQEGCVSAIASMLNAPDGETKEACVKALLNVASASGAAVAESVVHAIVKLSSKKEPASASFSAAAICNLSLLSGSRAKAVEDGVLDNVCELAQSALEGEVKEDLATALCNFSGLQANLEALSQVRVLECLEELLKVDSEAVRERCAVTIANISSFAPSLKNLVLSEAVAQLVDVGRRPSRAVQENTALSLSNMSATPDSRPLLARFGVVSLLLQFLEQDASAATKQHALVTLCSLLASPATCAELLQSNIPAVLAQLSGSAHDRTRDLCANALFNMSCDRGLHGFLLKDEPLRAIVRLCRRMCVNKDGVEVEDEAAVNPADKTPVVLQRSQECALGCLLNLSFADDARRLLVRADVVKTLFAVFQRPVRGDEAVRRCAGVVANLSFDAESRARMVEEHCVRLLRKLMGAAAASASKEALLCCSTACCNLAADGLDKTPVLAMLIELSGSPHADVTLTCAIAFAKLASSAALRPELTKCAELYPALTLMMRCGIEDIQIYSAVALCNLALERSSDRARARHVWQEGTVPAFIVNSLLRINSDSTKEICARALFNLLAHDEFRAAHIKEGVLYALVKLARLESAEIRALCVTALYNLSCDPGMADVLMEINVAQVVAKLCEMEFSSQDVHRRLAACLTNLAAKPGTELRLVEGGALAAVLALAEHGDPPTLRHCAAVLCYLSAQRASCEAMAAAGLLETLVRIAAADDARQTALALTALCNLSTAPALHDRLEEAGAVAQVVRLLGAPADAAVLLASAQTLCNLTAHARSRKAMLDKRIVRELCAVLAADTVTDADADTVTAADADAVTDADADAVTDAKKSRGQAVDAPVEAVDVCVEIVAVLAEDPQDWAELVAQGAVRVLRALAARCSPAARLSCVYALGQLARGDKAGVAVLADGALDVLAAAVPLLPAPAAAQLGERCAVILRSLSAAGESAGRLAEDARLVPLVRAVAAGGGREVLRHLVLALYNVSGGGPAALARLAAGGAVRLLVELAAAGGADLAPACAMALAHIKHGRQQQRQQEQEQRAAEGERERERERDAEVEAEEADGADEMEEGEVATLLAMVELDQAGIQRVDRAAAAVPAALPPLRPAERAFIPGDTAQRVGAQLPPAWVFHSSSIDDARFVPAEPRAFLPTLPPVVPASGVAVQDKLYGAFRVLRVRGDKVRARVVGPRQAPATAALADGALAADADALADAISRALADDADADADAAGGAEERAALADEAGDADEARAPSPAKKKSGARLDRAGSKRGSAGSAYELGVRRSSKSSLGAKGARQSTGGGSSGMVKRESQRKHTGLLLGSGESDRVVLPRL